MKYLVIHHTRNFTAVSVEPEGKIYVHPIKCWALNSGQKVAFVNTQMSTFLSKFYVSGTFQNKALYALDFEELCMMMEHKIGPDDETVYKALVNQKIVESRRFKPGINWIEVFDHTATLLFKCLWMTVKVLAFLTIIPFIIMWINKRK